MQYAQLGKSDLTVSRICFGCWQLSPTFWGKIEIETWQQAVRKALDLGVNFIDTADAYGDGFAEKSLGDLLKSDETRDRFVIATKFYWDLEAEKRHPNTDYDYILRACEASLRRLKTDHIDLYQIHAWDPLTRPAEVGAALRRLQKEGKIRWFGVSNLNAEQMRLYLQHFDFESLQPQYNFLSRDIEERDLPFCLRKRIGVIAYSPLYRGLLSGKYARDRVFTDSRAERTLFSGAAFQHMLDGLDKLRPYAEKHDLTLPQLAIRWILTHPALTAAIVGIKTPEHIETIVSAADRLLPRGDWFETAALMKTAKQEALQINAT